MFISFRYRGCFSLVRDVDSKHGAKSRRVAKISTYDPTKPEDGLREFEMLKAVRQEHVIRLHEAFLYNDFLVLVIEKMYGESVARSLSLKNRYNEQTVTEVIKQVSFCYQTYINLLSNRYHSVIEQLSFCFRTGIIPLSNRYQAVGRSDLFSCGSCHIINGVLYYKQSQTIRLKTRNP